MSHTFTQSYIHAQLDVALPLSVHIEFCLYFIYCYVYVNMARNKRPASRAGLRANAPKRSVNNDAITRYVFGPSATIPPSPSAPVVRHAIFSEPEQGISIHMLRLVVDLEPIYMMTLKPRSDICTWTE